MTSME